MYSGILTIFGKLWEERTVNFIYIGSNDILVMKRKMQRESKSERDEVLAKGRKILQRSKSERDIETNMILSSIVETCIKRGVNPHQFLIDLLSGKVDSIPNPKQNSDNQHKISDNSHTK